MCGIFQGPSRNCDFVDFLYVAGSLPDGRCCICFCTFRDSRKSVGVKGHTNVRLAFRDAVSRSKLTMVLCWLVPRNSLLIDAGGSASEVPESRIQTLLAGIGYFGWCDDNWLLAISIPDRRQPHV